MQLGEDCYTVVKLVPGKAHNYMIAVKRPQELMSKKEAIQEAKRLSLTSTRTFGVVKVIDAYAAITAAKTKKVEI